MKFGKISELNLEQKRKQIVQFVLSREGKNEYTQEEENRYRVDSGFSDCSSLVQWAYRKIGIEIGEDTGEQIKNGVWILRGMECPIERWMQLGDLLFFATDYDNGRIERVGHVEMYVGEGQISGHGEGCGPLRKNMLEYCKKRNADGKKFIGVKRYILGAEL